MRFLGWGVSVVSFVVGVTAAAQAQVLTLDQAVEKALSRSAEVRVFQTGIGIAQGEVLTSRLPSRFNPGVGLEFGPRFGNGFAGTQFDAAITIAQEFERGDRRQAREEVAVLGVQLSENQLSATRLRLTQRIRFLYTQFWREERLFQLATEREQLAQRLLEGLQERFKVGGISKIPVNIATVELSQSRAERERQLGELQARRNSLLALIGDEAETPVLAMQSLPPGPTSLPALPQLITLAQQNNPLLVAARSEQLRASAQVKLSEAEAHPNLTPLLSYRREGSENVVLGGVSFPLTVFNRNEGVIASANARQAQTRAQLDQTQVELRQQIEEGYARYQAAQRVLNIYSSETLRTIETNLGLLDEAFRAGKISVTDVLLARRDALAARALVLNARADLYSSFVLLQSATGGQL